MIPLLGRKEAVVTAIAVDGGGHLLSLPFSESELDEHSHEDRSHFAISARSEPSPLLGEAWLSNNGESGNPSPP